MSEYVCIYRIDFKDEGEPEYGVLARGTKEECERMANIVPAIPYSGNRPIEGCRIGVFEDTP